MPRGSFRNTIFQRPWKNLSHNIFHVMDHCFRRRFQIKIEEDPAILGRADLQQQVIDYFLPDLRPLLRKSLAEGGLTP